jgi:hypothetical protein
MIPLCKNCCYCLDRKRALPADPEDPQRYLCREPDNVDLVTGAALDIPCYDMRGGRCGRAGALFKAAPGAAPSINLRSRGALPLSG